MFSKHIRRARLSTLTALCCFWILSAAPLATLAETGTTAGSHAQSQVAPPAAAQAGEPESIMKKKDLGSFFLIGGIINVLFFAFVVHWGIKEMKKSKRKASEGQ